MSRDSREPLSLDRFDYDLPPERIAQSPVEPRDASRLLVVRRSDATLADHQFRDLPDLLHTGDTLVLNDTRVLPARLRGQRESGGAVELLLLHPVEADWIALARPARRLRSGERVTLLTRDGEPRSEAATVVGRTDEGVRIRLDPGIDLESFGEVPLPPYIRQAVDDPERYQTVYGVLPGSAAAPTAGLHFTERLLERCEERGISVVRLTLHVGLDTFQPIRSDNAREHVMHSESYHVPAVTLRVLQQTRERGGRIVAVGTTSVRTLETLQSLPHAIPEGGLRGATQLYITPGHEFRLVDVMVTNFHLPRTTLLILVSALAGEELTRRAYGHAIEHGYRFYSFGDAMLIV